MKDRRHWTTISLSLYFSLSHSTNPAVKIPRCIGCNPPLKKGGRFFALIPHNSSTLFFLFALLFFGLFPIEILGVLIEREISWEKLRWTRIGLLEQGLRLSFFLYRIRKKICPTCITKNYLRTDGPTDGQTDEPTYGHNPLQKNVVAFKKGNRFFCCFYLRTATPPQKKKKKKKKWSYIHICMSLRLYCSSVFLIHCTLMPRVRYSFLKIHCRPSLLLVRDHKT